MRPASHPQPTESSPGLGISAAPGSDATTSLVARAERDRRLLRLAQALRTFAEELAVARREIKRLQTENQRLKATKASPARS